MDYTDQGGLPAKMGFGGEVGAPPIEPSAPPPPPPSYSEAVGGQMPQPAPVPVPMPMPQTQPGYHHHHHHQQAPPLLHPVGHNPQPYPQQGPAYYRAPLPVGPKPLKTICPWCNRDIVTRIETKNKYSPHICCFLLLVSIVCACCSCLPYLLCPKERDEHFCPRCDASLGAYIHRR